MAGMAQTRMTHYFTMANWRAQVSNKWKVSFEFCRAGTYRSPQNTHKDIHPIQKQCWSKANLTHEYSFSACGSTCYGAAAAHPTCQFIAYQAWLLLCTSSAQLLRTAVCTRGIAKYSYRHRIRQTQLASYGRTFTLRV